MLRKSSITAASALSLGQHLSFTSQLGSSTSMCSQHSFSGGSWPDLSLSLDVRRKERPSLRWAWAALTLVLTLCSGLLLMRGNTYGHIHAHINTQYNSYVAAWQAGELTEFYNTHWMLIVDDQHIVPLKREADTSPALVRGRNMTTHVAFSIDALIPFVFYPVPGDDAHAPGVAGTPDNLKWKTVQPSMYLHQNFRLKGVHQSTGAISWVTLQDYPFVRRKAVLAGAKGLSRQQCQDRDGVQEADGSCTQLEYLEEVCIRVSPDTSSPDHHYYDIDTTHQGAGCYPEDGLIVPQYRHLPLGHLDAAAPPAKGGQRTFHLPKSAENATRMVMRHAHDPELMEKVLKHELREELGSRQSNWLAGAILALVSAVLLVPVARLASPVTVRVSRQLYLRWKFPHNAKDEEDELDQGAFSRGTSYARSAV